MKPKLSLHLRWRRYRFELSVLLFPWDWTFFWFSLTSWGNYDDAYDMEWRRSLLCFQLHVEREHNLTSMLSRTE